ncbi:MAG: hypothetical protein NTU49_09230 [Gammaproteobacteria bacterium]|nr:hypothetical protein [Gammaproteobacteria bacterium]
MTILNTQIKTDSEEFRNNFSLMKKRCETLAIILDEIKKIKPSKHKNKLSVRERIKNLIDPDTKFFELSPLAGFNLYEEALPAAGVITGVAKIQGIDCITKSY